MSRGDTHPEVKVALTGEVGARQPGHMDDAAGIKAPRQHPPGRRCRTCNRPLSRYNSTVRC